MSSLFESDNLMPFINDVTRDKTCILSVITQRRSMKESDMKPGNYQVGSQMLHMYEHVLGS